MRYVRCCILSVCILLMSCSGGGGSSDTQDSTILDSPVSDPTDDSQQEEQDTVEEPGQEEDTEPADEPPPPPAIGEIQSMPNTYTADTKSSETMYKAGSGVDCSRILDASDWKDFAGFAPPYDVSYHNTLLIQTKCEEGGNIAVQAGSVEIPPDTGVPIRYVYRVGYYHNGTNWISFDYHGDEVPRYPDWYYENASTVLTNPTQFQEEKGTVVVAYVCTWTDSSWKCGCRDAACETSYWNVQVAKEKQTEPETSRVIFNDRKLQVEWTEKFIDSYGRAAFKLKAKNIHSRTLINVQCLKLNVYRGSTLVGTTSFPGPQANDLRVGQTKTSVTSGLLNPENYRPLTSHDEYNRISMDCHYNVAPSL